MPTTSAMLAGGSLSRTRVGECPFKSKRMAIEYLGQYEVLTGQLLPGTNIEKAAGSELEPEPFGSARHPCPTYPRLYQPPRK
jgi:hypothetical protein